MRAHLTIDSKGERKFFLFRVFARRQAIKKARKSGKVIILGHVKDLKKL
jgi:polysaccharide deacetylase 2 family uncharacterized protein YibQ